LVRLDRAGFLHVEDLEIGERLERLDGRPARAARLELRPGLQRVFNLEVPASREYEIPTTIRIEAVPREWLMTDSG